MSGQKRARKGGKEGDDEQDESIEARIAQAIKAALESAQQNSNKTKRLSYVDMSKRMEAIGKLEASCDWEEWKEAVGDIGYVNGWDPDILSNEEKEWEEEKHESENDRINRKQAYLLMKSSIDPKLRYLVKGKAKGDAIGVWQALRKHFERDTPASYQAAQKQYTECSMHSADVNLAEFIALLDTRAQNYVRLGGTVSDKEKASKLLAGLLPCFEQVRTLLEMQDSESVTYNKVRDVLQDYVESRGLTNTKRTNSSQRANTFHLHDSSSNGNRRGSRGKGSDRSSGGASGGGSGNTSLM